VSILALGLKVRDLSTCHLEDVTVLRDDNKLFSPDVQPGGNDSNRTENPVSLSPTWLCRPYGQELQAPKTRPEPALNFAV
jgi:hypothetical protein